MQPNRTLKKLLKKLKQLNIKESGEIDYNTLKRQKILDYFGAYNNWERLVTDASSITTNNYQLHNESLLERIKEAKLSYNFKEGEIELFIKEQEFYELRKNISVNLLKLQQEFEIHCLNVDKIISTESNPTYRFEKIKEEKTNYHNILLSKLRELMPFRNGLIEFLETCLKESFS